MKAKTPTLQKILKKVSRAMDMPTLETERLWVRHLSLADPEAVLDFYRRNESHLRPTDPPHPEDFYSHGFWQKKVEDSTEEFQKDSAVRFVLCPKTNLEKIVGSCNLSQISRGPFQACYLGYALDGDFVGQGLMSEALRAVTAFAFEKMELHRIMANFRTENIRSRKVLEGLNFREEGIARKYLFIDGDWRDHVLMSLTNEDF
jgi:ribosomal-protein-alanine N-acetyltransferase